MIGDFYVIFGGFFGDFLVGTGEPPPYCDKIPTKSQQIKFLSILKKSCDWVRPPPLLGPNSQLLPKICFEGSPYLVNLKRRSTFIFVAFPEDVNRMLFSTDNLVFDTLQNRRLPKSVWKIVYIVRHA